MIRFVLITLLAFLFLHPAKAQNITGQWKGEFIDNSSKFGSWGGDKCEYVLELEAKGSKVTGYSYTYFSNGDKRYYTICKLAGTYNKATKTVEVKEYERTKTNVPVEIGNCFQVHKLTFLKKTDSDESLEGSWIPAPNQQGNCGYGATVLTRRNLKSSFPGLKNPTTTPNSFSRVNPPKTTAPRTTNTATAKKLPNLADKSKTITVKPTFVKPKTAPAVAQQPAILPKKDTQVQETQTAVVKPNLPSAIISGNRYEKRSNTVLKTIEIENELVKIDLYDNGEIDGDSISLFLNGKLLMARKKLTAQPLTITLSKEDLLESNDLVMYAENLGTIPPNTALMIVTDGKKRYEVRITSDLQKSGTIRFVKRD